MIIYCNQEIPHNIEDVCHEIQYDEYVYSANGIYKKYKYHFYEINTESEEKACLFKNKEFVLQEKEARLDKNKIIEYKYHLHQKLFLLLSLIKNKIKHKGVAKEFYNQNH